MQELPSELKEHIVEWDYEDQRIIAMARLEAEMTFMKRKTGSENAGKIYIEPRVMKTKQDLFTFTKILSVTLAHLELGNLDVSPEVEKLFSMEIKE